MTGEDTHNCDNFPPRMPLGWFGSALKDNYKSGERERERERELSVWYFPRSACRGGEREAAVFELAELLGWDQGSDQGFGIRDPVKPTKDKVLKNV